MSIQDLIHLYFERSTALQNYWTLYVVIIGGVLGISTLRPRTSWVTTLMISILYLSFAYKNLGAIHDTTMQRLAVLESIREANRASNDPTIGRLVATMDVPAYDGVRNFHVFCDVLTIATLWVFEIRRHRYRREDSNRPIAD